MEGRGSELSANGTFVPQIMVTEPSPVINNTTSTVQSATPTTSTVQSATPTTEGTSQQNKGETSTTVDVIQRAANVFRPETSREHESSEEFAAAQSCNECVVPVPEQSQSVDGTTTATSENDQDDFRTGTESGYSCCIRCLDYYAKLWNIMHSAYAIPVWLFLLALPLSAGVMGALNMYSCPAAHAIATLVFIIGISLLASIALKICLIIHRRTYEDENSRNLLHTLMLVATFLTVVIFVTESVAFWRMDSTPHPGTNKYCNPHFVTFAFWWNCAMSVVIVPIFLFPA